MNNDNLTSLDVPGKLIQSAKSAVWSLAQRCGIQGLCTWGFEQNYIRLEHRNLPLYGLGEAFEELTIVHLSDLHFSPLMRERHLERYLEIVNDLQPDFIVLTGDFITASPRHYARRAGMVLSQLQPRIASFACLGNHDYGLWHPKAHKPIRGLGPYVADQLARAGIEPLRNESRTFLRNGQKLHFVGLGDLWSGDCNPAVALDGLDRREPIIALVHNPDAAVELAARGARAILAGHTHGRPTGKRAIHRALFPVKYPKFVGGHYSLGDDRMLYVNRGLGSAYRIRPEDRPEITLFTLRRINTRTKPRPLSRTPQMI